MSISKRAFLTSAGLVITVPEMSFAQTSAPKGNKKSSEAGTIGEGEAYMIDPKGHRLHKSHVKVSASQHEAAIKKGGREIKPGAVIYRQSGKLYMLEDNANEKASENFQDNFAIDY
jgi:hypothetical protein